MNKRYCNCGSAQLMIIGKNPSGGKLIVNCKHFTYFYQLIRKQKEANLEGVKTGRLQAMRWLNELEKEIINDISAFKIADYTHKRFEDLKKKIEVE